MKQGLLLINLGTPDSTKTRDVRRYLRQFLSDPRVLDIPALLRFILLNLVILPTRPRKSAAAYAQIWTEQGSPLLLHGQDLTEAVASKLGPDWEVSLAMRYGNPSIESAICQMQSKRVSSIYVVPLFPQYASSSYGSALSELYAMLRKHDYVQPVQVKAPYYADADFIDVLTKVTQSELASPDYLLMSFHGLPKQHVIKSDGGSLPKACQADKPCPKITFQNSTCYRAQSYATARALSTALGVKNYGVAFQSRLGKTPWIKPYTDEFLSEIYQAGHRKLAVVCPSFVADCLETLEEIGIGLKEDWLAMGGEEFQLISCLNSHKNWADLIANWAKKGQR